MVRQQVVVCLSICIFALSSHAALLSITGLHLLECIAFLLFLPLASCAGTCLVPWLLISFMLAFFFVSDWLHRAGAQSRLISLWLESCLMSLLLGCTGACSVLAGAGMLVVLYFFSCLEVSSWHLKSTLLSGSYHPLFACGCPRGLLSLRPLDDDDDDIQIHMHWLTLDVHRCSIGVQLMLVDFQLVFIGSPLTSIDFH